MNMISQYALSAALGFVFCGGPPFNHILHPPKGGNGGGIENGPGKPICTYCTNVGGAIGAIIMMYLVGHQFTNAGMWGTIVPSIAGGLLLGTITHSVMGAFARG
jgi:hypothetical protein